MLLIVPLSAPIRLSHRSLLGSLHTSNVPRIQRAKERDSKIILLASRDG